MKIKLQDEYEIGMYYEGQKKNMKPDDIELYIQILRMIKEME